MANGAPGRSAVLKRSQGLTLIELLIATSIFLMLGGSLILFLRVGIDTWRVGEIRREAYERAQAIIDEIASDLSCTFSDPSKGTGGIVDVLFVSDYDPNGRQRMRFVRSLAGEMRHPITQKAGALTGGQFDYDYVDDAQESEWGTLRAPGGLQEVAYVMDIDPASDMLWRSVKSPIGGLHTLFDELNLYDDQVAPPKMTRRMRPFADGVMYLEFNFWGQETASWTDNEGGRGPQVWWDSTGAIVDAGDYFDPDSRHEHRDDVFPSRVQVTLVLRPARAAKFARLTRPLGSDDVEIRVGSTSHYPEGAFQYVRVGDEWIRYDTKSKTGFLGLERGVRGSEAMDHPVGTPVIYGTTFTRVIRVPGARSTNWGRR